MVQKKLVFILIDGVGDIAHTYTDMKTPLTFANIKNIDSISSNYSFIRNLLWNIKETRINC